MLHWSWRSWLVALALLGAACAGPPAVTGPEGAEPGAAGAKADRGGDDEARFVDVDPDRPLDADARSRIGAALDRLLVVAETGESKAQRALARETVERIADGDVLIGGVASAIPEDLWHMCKDLGYEECEGERSETWQGSEELREAIAGELDGYMWGNRLYFAFDETSDTDRVAGTLVHEVNHVLNRSDCSYYSDLTQHTVEPTLAFIEEYRAFVSECLYRQGAEATAEGCDAYALTELEEREYGLTPDLTGIVPDGDSVWLAEMLLFPDEGDDEVAGVLIPGAASWPEDFTPCDD